MKPINARQLAEKYRNFYQKNGHKWLPSSPLMPQDDPSALFVSAGMHPLVPYLLGESHPLGKRLVNVQECLRTGDIDEVGDTYHHTWFEMLGHWSFGDYFKKEAIKMSYQFLTKELGLDPNRLAFTVFAGNSNAEKDQEAFDQWQKMGIPKERIAFLEKENWWELPGGSGPCGPSTEAFYWWNKSKKSPKRFDPSDDNWLEIGNDVLMQYQKTAPGKYQPAKQKNIDNGTGVERTLAVLNSLNDNYRTSIFWPIVEKIEALFNKKYGTNIKTDRSIRIIADHIRSAVFILADGVTPSNKEQGYVLRQLIRRAVRQGELLGGRENFTQEVALSVLENQDNYAGQYPELDRSKERILEEIANEEIKFRKTLVRGLKEIGKIISKLSPGQQVSGKNAFFVYESFGFPLEMIVSEAKNKGFSVDRSGFKKAKSVHQKKSRTAAKGRFKGGLSGHSAKAVGYHTTTHLLQSALKKVLGDHVAQIGSNITEERLRFDFTHSDSLTDEEIKEVEKLVNKAIKDDLPVTVTVLSFEEAIKKGSSVVSGKIYPDEVKVYCVGDLPDGKKSAKTASIEVCGGPHVKQTGRLGQFKIIKEQSSGAGKRRIYGILK